MLSLADTEWPLLFIMAEVMETMTLMYLDASVSCPMEVNDVFTLAKNNAW